MCVLDNPASKTYTAGHLGVTGLCAQDQFRATPAKLRRTWKVPELVDASSIRAKLANGELVITLPKTVKVRAC